MAFVYKFLNYKNEIIYIGKTQNLERRMKQHFEEQGHLPKECYDQVNQIFYIEVDGKTNVDMYETFLINEYKPIYNIEKQFNELTNLHKNDFIQIKEIEWKELFFWFTQKGIQTSKVEIIYPFFDNNLHNYDKSQKLIEFNYYNLIKKEGMYNHYIPNIIKDHENLIEYLKIFHNEILKQNNFVPQNSCFDELISNKEESVVYAAIDIRKLRLLDIEKLLAMVQCKMLIRLSGNVYGVIVHTPYTLKHFSKHYTLNEFDIIMP